MWDLTQHLTKRTDNSHAPLVSTFPKAPLHFKGIHVNSIPGSSILEEIYMMINPFHSSLASVCIFFPYGFSLNAANIFSYLSEFITMHLRSLLNIIKTAPNSSEGWINRTHNNAYNGQNKFRFFVPIFLLTKM